jgi:hypothetical protein
MIYPTDLTDSHRAAGAVASYHRRLAKDYEVKDSHAEAIIYWMMIRLMSRRIRGTQS